MMRWRKVYSASMNIKMRAEVLIAHGRALKVPARKTQSPWRRPFHQVLGFGLYPKGKIKLTVFFVLAAKRTRISQQVFQVAAIQNTIVRLLTIFLNIKIYGTVNFISKAFF